jgi:hypothetical protein
MKGSGCKARTCPDATGDLKLALDVAEVDLKQTQQQTEPRLQRRGFCCTTARSCEPLVALVSVADCSTAIA